MQKTKWLKAIAGCVVTVLISWHIAYMRHIREKWISSIDRAHEVKKQHTCPHALKQSLV